VEKYQVDVIVPIYNEEACLPEMQRRLSQLRSAIADDHHMQAIYVDDGSKDRSRTLLLEIAEQNDWVKVVFLARNFGHQIAVTAGLENSTGDYVAIIDGDLQDPPELIEPMIKTLKESNSHVVFGQRASRDGETKFKTATASIFYKLIRKISAVDIPLDTGDFRVMDRKARDIMISMPEKNRFLRGMIPWTGLSATPFIYQRDSRFSGTTKYSMKQMLVLASNAVVSFSITPLRAIQLFGLLTTGVSALATLAIMVAVLCGQHPSMILLLATFQSLLSGVILTAVGILGGYLHRIQDEVRHRPLYVVEDIKN
jgi:dolichol-phosphate mannosyltransferase